MKLLRDIETTGLPGDYLFARVRYRRAALARSGQGRWSGTGGPHQALRAEYAWVYTQLEPQLRRRLLPFFGYVELRTLVIALRYIAGDDRAAVAAQLQDSLLHPQLQKLLLGAHRVSNVIAKLEDQLSDAHPFFAGLTSSYLRQGPGALEQQLLGGYLHHALKRCRYAPLRELLRYLLDMRNLLALYKHLHWQVTAAPPLLDGGTLQLARCEQIWSTHDLPRLLEAMRRIAGQTGDPEAVGVEEFLLQGLTDRLRRKGREPLQPELLLDYLWRCQQTAREHGLRLSRSTESAPPPLEVAG